MTWFKNVFLPSFKLGETRISKKQYAVFCKYLQNHEKNVYYNYVNGLEIIVTKYANFKTEIFVLRIKQDNREKRKECFNKIKELEKQADAILEKKGECPEVDEIEKQIDKLFDIYAQL